MTVNLSEAGERRVDGRSADWKVQTAAAAAPLSSRTQTMTTNAWDDAKKKEKTWLTLVVLAAGTALASHKSLCMWMKDQPTH